MARRPTANPRLTIPAIAQQLRDDWWVSVLAGTEVLEDSGLVATLTTAPFPVPLPVLLAVLLAVLSAELVSALLPAAALARFVAVLDSVLDGLLIVDDEAARSTC